MTPSRDRAAAIARLRAAGCVYAEDEADLLLAATQDVAEFQALLDARIGGRPLEQVLGWAEFCGFRFVVAPGVFVPRSRTELIVRLAAPRLNSGDLLVDLCCGTGAVGAVLAHRVGSLTVHAVDIDPAATECATENLAALDATVYTGDLDEPLPDSLRGRVDVITANAPYVPTDEIPFMPSEARDHEAIAALDGGPDGVDIHRRIARAATDWLRPGGWLFIETSERQAPLTMTACRDAGLAPSTHFDEAADAVVVVSRLAQ